MSGPFPASEPAPAKINLYLHVVGRRPDGYRLLDSLVAFAAEHDLIEALPGDGLALEVTGPFATALANSADNIVLGAARRLAAEAGVAANARIRLTKSLPVAAGLGGGSADAAATLRALSTLWRLAPDAADLARIGLTLGADIPVCLFGATAYMAGIGEIIEPGPRLPPLGVVLVNPRVPVATAEVFRARSGPFSEPGRMIPAPDDADTFLAMLEGRHNDLAAAACRVAPVIGHVLAALAADPACRIARLSGSGASCFGLYRNRPLAAAAAARLAILQPDWWVRATSFV